MKPASIEPDPEPAITSMWNDISTKRKRAGEAQMTVNRSRVIFVPGEPWDNVTIHIPMVDRGRSEPRHLLGVVRDRDDNDLYTLAYRGGILRGKYSGNQFDLWTHRLLSDDDINTTNIISLRQAVQHKSNCGGRASLSATALETSCVPPIAANASREMFNVTLDVTLSCTNKA